MNHRSIPPRLGTHLTLSVLSRERRNPRVVVLPSFASLSTPSACTASVPALRLVLRAVTPAVSLPAIRFAALSALL